MMKHFRIALVMLLGIGLLSCSKELPQSPDPAAETGSLTFNLSLSHPDGAGTKAVKSNWEDGDVVFVFFSGAKAPRYLRMQYVASEKIWEQTPMNGTSAENFALTGTEGTMSALYLPFGSDMAVGTDPEDEELFAFYRDDVRTMDYSYYFMAENVPYTVSDGVVSGALPMKLPEGFVQFFLEDESFTEEGAAAVTLWESHVAPRGVFDASATGFGCVLRPQGMAMPAHYYQGGYLFSGILDKSVWGEETDYEFHLQLSPEQALIARGTKTLYTETSRALKLPAADWEGWTEDPHPAVDLGVSVKWAVVNLGADRPTALGDYYAWGETETKVAFDSFNYKWLAEGSYDAANSWRFVNKYTFDDGQTGDLGGIWYDAEDNFIGDGYTRLSQCDYADDAARAQWGGSWRIPSKLEWGELTHGFDWSWESDYNGSGTAGYVVTSQLPGYEGRSIFLPAAGIYSTINTTEAQPSEISSSGYYLVDCLSEKYSDVHGRLQFGATEHNYFEYGGSVWRADGMSVRPVCD